MQKCELVWYTPDEILPAKRESVFVLFREPKTNKLVYEFGVLCDNCKCFDIVDDFIDVNRVVAWAEIPKYDVSLEEDTK